MKNPALFALFTSLSLSLPLASRNPGENRVSDFFAAFPGGTYFHAAYYFASRISFLLYGIFLYLLSSEKSTAARKERFSVAYLSFFSLFAVFLSEYFCFYAPFPAIFFTFVFAVCAAVLAKMLREKSRPAALLVFAPLAVCAAKLYFSFKIMSG